MYIWLLRKIEEQKLIINQETHKIDFLVADDMFVKVIKTIYETELQELKYRNDHGTIRKLNKWAYQVISTGKIGFYNKKGNRRVDNLISLRRTIQKNRTRIASNFYGAKNEFMFTLTYANKVFDLEKLNADINAFNVRLKRWVSRENLGEIVYMFAREAHADGSWHIHMLIRFKDQKKVYIPNRFKYQNKKNQFTQKRTFEQIKRDKIDAPIFDLWGNGVVRVQRMNNIDSVANYLSTYMTNVLVDELDEKELAKVKKQGKTISPTVSDESKSYIKGQRLKYFPSNARIFSWSQNYVEPEVFMMKYGEARQTFGLKDENMNYRTANEVVIENDNYEKPFINRIVREGYNSKVTVKHNVFLSRQVWANWQAQTKDMIKNDLEWFKVHAPLYLANTAKAFVKFYHYNVLSEFDKDTKQGYLAWRKFVTKAEEKKYEELRRLYQDTLGISIQSFQEAMTPAKYQQYVGVKG